MARLGMMALAVLASLTGAARAEAPAKPWCAPELEALPHDVCFHAGGKAEGRRTLVVFLHGLVQRGAGWQHNQMRAAVRGAKRLGYSVLAPRGRDGANRRGPDMVAWPTSRKAQVQHEASVLAEWRAARALVEDRQGAPFDEVFVVGFSNGAYYGSSLALRGQEGIDGYAVFAGGAGHGAPTAEVARRAPIFVGIAAKDSTSAADSRALARRLKKAKWPHRAESRKVGHTMADAHLDHAIAYLRGEVDGARGVE